ncbi:nucleolar complex-associated protein 3 [Epithele typhae]|uniref:nucleolar complex-associated protein 3 n=1 Tax=Epithele typhae TaxID=378194 RepID=UPI002007DCEE|nr:nucleolar complex-associated protein 3 [Epithele typhae]KAH9946186.1 nucleolar complex-associated protein 3 [Epithele typhae]
MVVKGSKKRPAQAAQRGQGASKKRKVAADSGKPAKGKERASDRTTIPIPNAEDEGDVELSDDDAGLLEEYGTAASFLQSLDRKGIARSKKETERLHQLHKPVRKAVEDDLPSVNSHSEDEDDWSSAMSGSEPGSEAEAMSDPGEESASEAESSRAAMKRQRRRKHAGSDEEMPFERSLLADGRVQKSSSKVFLDVSEESGLESESADEEAAAASHPKVDDVSTGARFGRPAVVDVISQKSRKARVQGAKEQIAGLCQEIMGDPENSLGLLRRLHTFSLPEITTPTHPDPVPNDPMIRRLTMLSQLAVFKDIIPGYRIRALTDKEKAEKVSQMVQRTRDWEQGLVGVYQAYLRSLEVELKAKSEFAEPALHCMCTLLVEVTHFNFRVNLMTSIVAALSRRSWDKANLGSVPSTLIKVFRTDLTGEPSLEAVRLLNRMIKERKYQVHPEVLSCLFHLRLKSELGVRASETKGKATDQPHLSKKAKKVLKERKEIEKDMHEAAAEVDQEERASRHTEALKLLFVLYFSVLKNPRPTPLLPAALRGISRFAHLVNIDFFKDLLQVLKTLMTRDADTDEDGADDATAGASAATAAPDGGRDIATVQHQLLCVVTAFELLSGQADAHLSLAVSKPFVASSSALAPLRTSPPPSALTNRRAHPGPNPRSQTAPDLTTSPLHAPARPLRRRSPRHRPRRLRPPALRPPPPPRPPPRRRRPSARVRPGAPPSPSVADTLFRALTLALTPRAASAAPPPARAAAFARRLLAAALHWPPGPAARAVAFVGELAGRAPALDALFATDERGGGGVGGGGPYRWDVDDPQVANALGAGGAFWELRTLRRRTGRRACGGRRGSCSVRKCRPGSRRRDADGGERRLGIGARGAVYFGAVGA